MTRIDADYFTHLAGGRTVFPGQLVTMALGRGLWGLSVC